MKNTISILLLFLSCAAFSQSKLDLLSAKCRKAAIVSEQKRHVEMQNEHNAKGLIMVRYTVESLTLTIENAVQDSVLNNKYYVTGSYIVNVLAETPADRYSEASSRVFTSTKKFSTIAKEMLGDFVVSDFKSK